MKKVRKIDVVQEEREKKKLKVAAYCRVSTKYESQKSSIDLQVSYFTQLIEKKRIGRVQAFMWILEAGAGQRAGSSSAR